MQSENSDWQGENLLQIPSINLPRGGGALKSIDEKFQVNAANGTAAFSITIPLSKSRGDFAPALSLNYNSGSGNSPFGLGWNISLPSIRRRTDKLLPKYQDAYDSDIFQLAGVEDLVLQLLQNSRGDWVADVITPTGYQVKRYRPRIEAAFTLIEEVDSAANGVYWKTTAKDNTVTFYGLTTEGRVADPADPSRIFEWLPEISFDDKGNCFQFQYVPENGDNVPLILHEGNRLNGNQSYANTYLKKILYGNTTPYSPAPAGGDADPYLPANMEGLAYHFTLALDYGDYDPDSPAYTPTGTWGCRLDPFSNGKAGFDLRTYRLCRRFLLFHQFTGSASGADPGSTLGQASPASGQAGPTSASEPVLVKSLDLTYQHYDFQTAADPDSLTFVEADFITSVTETGWIVDTQNGYQSASYPPLSFTYQLPQWRREVQTVSAQNRMNIPEGLIAPYQFTDLYNEGIAGILSEQSEGWYYNHNLGEGVFTPASLVSPKPSFTGLNGGDLQLQSLTGDGRKFIVSTRPPNQGSFQLAEEGEWLPFVSFEKYPRVDLKDPNIKFLDLNGDGMPDIVLSEEQIFTWYPATGITGYDSPELAPKPFDEEKGPAIVFADPVESIFLADMTGDGMTDIVRIRNGEISYWPNFGYGIFGAKVNMTHAPVFDTIDLFNPAYLHLADINGTGATDILYLGKDRLRAWLNLSGNAWGDCFETSAFPDTSNPNQLSVADFLGNGTACIIWSSPLAANADHPLRYIDLMGGHKPYLMKGYSNGMGKQVDLSYQSSTYFYLLDKQAGEPWITQLCFPVQCVQRICVTDTVSGSHYSSSYTYHHGYYDHPEKEYRGFGRVEQTDADTYDTNAAADQVPVRTKTWFHTGAYFGIDNILHQLAGEYFKNPAFTEYSLPEPALPSNQTAEEAREAARACKGMTLRQEVYALDADRHPTLAGYPYSAAEHNNTITLLQPRGPNLYAVFLSTESEAITYHYERNPADPRIGHTLNTAFDPYGNIVDSYSVVYARQPVNPASPGGMVLPGGQSLPAAVIPVQQSNYIIYTHHSYTAAIITAPIYRLPVDCETVTWQWAGTNPPALYFSIDYLTNYAGPPPVTMLKHQRTLFLQDNLTTILPLGTMSNRGLVYQQYHLAINAGVTNLNAGINDGLLYAAGYILSDDYMTSGYFPASDAKGEWWVHSGNMIYDPVHFYLPIQFLDGYGYTTTVAYDGYFLLIDSITDPLVNITTAVFDYRVLAPVSVTDPNGNVSYCQYDTLGLLVAIAQYGKGEGDQFDAGFTADLTAAQIAAFFSYPYTYASGAALLQGATIRYIYDFVAGGPFSTGIISRQTRKNQAVDSRVDTSSVPYQYSFEYTDGLGRTAMKKVPADPTTGTPLNGSCDGNSAPQHQWIGSGKTVYNNKGKPVMQYEPYFSNTPAYEEAPANGVTPVLHYDPIGRLVRTWFPDQTFSSTEFDAWVEIVYDQNDNVAASKWYTDSLASPDIHQQHAAEKAFAHNDTPTTNHLDPLGRNFYSVAFNIVGGSPVFYATQTVLDIESNPLAVIDPMQNTVMQWSYDLLKRRIYQSSMDAGVRYLWHDVMDKPFMQWDQNGTYTIVYTYGYDKLHRPTQTSVAINGSSYLSAYNVYGEGIGIDNGSGVSLTDLALNLRGKLFRQFDASGLVTNYCYDLGGNLLQSSRLFATAFQSPDPHLPVVSWAGDSGDLNLLYTEEHVTLMAWDALNRPMLQTRPFGRAFDPSVAGTVISPPAFNQADVTVWGYGESGGLNTVTLYYGGGTRPTPFVNRICHNEKGQRLCIQYGNNTVIRYTYDPNTFRLTRLLSTGNSGTVSLQDLNYYYDPVGNITYQWDKDQPTVVYGNQTVKPDGAYTYDAVYRLITAKGREQIGQNTVNEDPGNSDYRNYPFNSPASTDSNAMRNYTDSYSYDAAGNMQQLQHSAGAGSYTRTFAYNNNVADRTAFGVAAATTMNNQLMGTTVIGYPQVAYGYDGHGNMLNLPELPGMGWNYKDEFVAATQQAVTTGTGLTTYYTYDASGMRTRKVTVGAASAATVGGTAGATAGSAGPAKVSERLYIGNFEIYLSYDTTGKVNLRRETLHVMDDKSRIATVDNKTLDNTGGSDGTATNTYYPRFQYGNHLGSAMYELDGGGNIISYEEYHPFGTTSYQAAGNLVEVPLKRYRYTGKERDEESGLYYHGARYYAPWLCRWTSADPVGVGDGVNVYSYCSNNPIIFQDRNGNEQTAGEQLYDQVPQGLTEKQAIDRYNADVGKSQGIKVTSMKKEGNDWHITGYEKIPDKANKPKEGIAAEKGEKHVHEISHEGKEKEPVALKLVEGIKKGWEIFETYILEAPEKYEKFKDFMKDKSNIPIVKSLLEKTSKLERFAEKNLPIIKSAGKKIEKVAEKLKPILPYIKATGVAIDLTKVAYDLKKGKMDEALEDSVDAVQDISELMDAESPVGLIISSGKGGYWVGKQINKMGFEHLVDKAQIGSGALGDFYYRHFLQ